MSNASEDQPQSLLESVRPLVEAGKDRISVADMLDRIDEDDGLGPVLFMMTLPVLVPSPPGVSMILALPLLLIAPQVVAGRTSLWLPGWLGDRTVECRRLAALLKRVEPWVGRAERIVRPRLCFLTTGLATRVIGLVCTLLALVLVLPIPFANFVPAVALGAFALALTRRDGLLALAGCALVALGVLVVVLGVHGVSAGVRLLPRL